LVAGDAIVAIAGEPVAGLGFEGCIERLRGPEGTTVIVLVRHADGREETLVVPRRRIRA
jgi:C-terminal processing protease CtpA/Prc